MQAVTIKEEDFKNLDLRLDDDGLLKCHGRLRSLQTESKPIFLPPGSPLLELFVRAKHEKCMHGSPAMTLACLRQEAWIPRARRLVRNIVNHCPGCKRWRSKPFMLPKMPPYPIARTEESKPFTHIGVDYFGPIYVRSNREMKKRWVALFTCMATRAIHLELAEDLSAETFLQVFRRFVARRGMPSTIISDNVTNFVLTKKTLALLKEKLSRQEIRWSLITQRAPWQGGFYERLIGVTKDTLRRAVANKRLTEQHFITLLVECEAIVNSRPLTYLDNDSLEYIRPIDFLLPKSEVSIDPGHDKESGDFQFSSAEKVLEKWRTSQDSLRKFWSFWKDAYVTSLRERYQLTHRVSRAKEERTPRVGEVVLIKSEVEPRGKWKLGRVIKLQGGNGIRTAEVEISNHQTILRPINHLYPLEIDASEELGSNEISAKNIEQQPERGNKSVAETGQGKRNEKVVTPYRLRNINRHAVKSNPKDPSNMHGKRPLLPFYLLTLFMISQGALGLIAPFDSSHQKSTTTVKDALFLWTDGILNEPHQNRELYSQQNLPNNGQKGMDANFKSSQIINNLTFSVHLTQISENGDLRFRECPAWQDIVYGPRKKQAMPKACKEKRAINGMKSGHIWLRDRLFMARRGH